jgi:hypothetical protein
MIDAAFAPAMETGTEIVTKNAAGDLYGVAKHGDMPKYGTVNLGLVTQDPQIEQLLCGGTILNANGTVLTTPTTLAATPSATGGTLVDGTGYGYRLTACNQYGETLAEASVPATVSASTGHGSVALAWSATSSAVYYRIYGRTSGSEQLLFQTTGLAWTDTGLLVPNGALPLSNTSAGPGQVGYQAPSLGIVGQPNFVSLEIWTHAWIKNVQAPIGFFRWVFPGCKNFYRDAFKFGDSRLEAAFSGDSFENPNWGAGPMGDWPQDSTKWFQRERNFVTSLPAVGWSPVAETA